MASKFYYTVYLRLYYNMTLKHFILHVAWVEHHAGQIAIHKLGYGHLYQNNISLYTVLYNTCPAPPSLACQTTPASVGWRMRLQLSIHPDCMMINLVNQTPPTQLHNAAWVHMLHHHHVEGRVHMVHETIVDDKLFRWNICRGYARMCVIIIRVLTFSYHVSTLISPVHWSWLHHCKPACTSNSWYWFLFHIVYIYMQWEMNTDDTQLHIPKM